MRPSTVVEVLLSLLLAVSVPAADANTDNTGTDTQVKAEVENEADVEEVRSDMKSQEAYNISSFIDYQYNKVGGNVLYSPYSLNTAMGMLMQGAEGNSLDELLTYYMVDSLEEKATLDSSLVARYNIIGELPKKAESSSTDGELKVDAGGPLSDFGDTVSIYTANGLFVDENLAIKSTYVDRLNSLYNADAKVLDFKENSVKSADFINNWVATNTNDKITQITNAEAVKQLDAALVNTLYFKAPWKDAYDDFDVKDKEFKSADGSISTVKGMWETKENGTYYEYEGHKAFAKEYLGTYKNGEQYDFSFIGILPSEKVIDANGDFSASDINIQKLLETKTKMYTVDSMMPKFKLESSMDCIPYFESMGVNDIFDVTASNLKGIYEGTPENNLYISSILQKVTIDVNEEGTEASAATMIGMAVGCAPGMEKPEIKEVILDRPFMFLIYDNSTETILFAGKITELKA